MKSYTDLSQSKILAEILPLESADMSYTLNFDSERYEISTTSYKGWIVPKYAQTYKGLAQVIPCWSLAALLDVLKDDIKIEKHYSTNQICLHIQFLEMLMNIELMNMKILLMLAMK